MDQYEIRVNQLKRMKASLLVRSFLVFLLIIGALTGIYFIIKNTDISWIHLDEVKTTFLYKLIYFSLTLIISTIVLIILLSVSNNVYRKFYKECIYSECKLEEIYLLDNKVTNNKIVNIFLEKVLFSKYIKFVSSYSDASSKFSCDINLIKY